MNFEAPVLDDHPLAAVGPPRRSAGSSARDLLCNASECEGCASGVLSARSGTWEARQGSDGTCVRPHPHLSDGSAAPAGAGHFSPVSSHVAFFACSTWQ